MAVLFNTENFCNIYKKLCSDTPRFKVIHTIPSTQPHLHKRQTHTLHTKNENLAESQVLKSWLKY